VEIFEKIEEQEFEGKKKKDKTKDKERHKLIIGKMMEKVNKIKKILNLN
jgi:hypothetical protein